MKIIYIAYIAYIKYYSSMSLVTSIDDLSHYTSNIIAPDIGSTSNNLIRYIDSTSNSISNRITDLYTKDITFQQDVTVNSNLTVSGNLTVDGNTISINTDSYTTEILEIVSTNIDNSKPVLKIVENSGDGNIIEVHNNTTEVITVDNSGKLFTQDIEVDGSGYFAGDITTTCNITIGGVLDIQGTNPTINLLSSTERNTTISFKELSQDYGFDMTYLGEVNKFHIRGYNNSATPRTDMTFLRSNGNVGIGTTNPTEKLHVSGSFNASSIQIGNYAYGWLTRWNESGGGGETTFYNKRGLGSGYFVFNNMNQDGTSYGRASIYAGNVYAHSTNLVSFTGNHICKASTIDLYDDKYIGYIVSSSKQYSSLNSTYHKDNIKQNINKEKNDCLPYVQLTSKENDKNAFGIIYKIENETDTERKQENGGFVTTDSKKSYDRRVVVSGCGEGFVWVSDYNGNIEAGDLISSSPIPGIGMKQNDDLLHSYTVAKITMDCDFNPGYIPVKVLQSSNYDVEYITTSNIISSSNVQENELLTSNYEVEYISDTIDIINTSNITTYLKDDNGEYLYENLLDSNGDVVYDFEYEMKYIKLDGTIIDKEEYENSSNAYRMALVGSCYKCS